MMLGALLLTGHCYAQVKANNIGFENGTFDGWEFGIGNIYEDGHMRIEAAIAAPGSFEILDNDGTERKDPIGNFSVFAPNGSKYCVKLGNMRKDNSVQQMSYKLTVPALGANSVIFNYAVVLVNPNHPKEQQPRFTVKIFNVTDGKYLDCPAFDFVSSTNMPGFKFTSDGIFYKDWATASINLTGLNSKEIRLEFTVNHCPYTEHYGYAYLDVKEEIGLVVTGTTYCQNQSAATFTAPPGFATYEWFTGDLKTSLGTGQTINLSPIPKTLTEVAVKVTPYDGLGCTDILYSPVKQINTDLIFPTSQTLNGCVGGSVDLEKAILPGGSPGLTVSYLNADGNPLPSPHSITTPGAYYIRAVNEAGCNEMATVNVTFDDFTLDVTALPPVTYPETVSLQGAFTPKAGVTYTYWKDSGTSVAIQDPTAVGVSGTYYVQATSPAGCTDIQPVKVTILPPPPYEVNAPNTFTPNNDGVNDCFTFTVKGYIAFESLQIFNRYGTLVYKESAPQDCWDGTSSGKALPDGVYYWVFNGTNTYSHQKVTQGSYVTILR